MQSNKMTHYLKESSVQYLSHLHKLFSETAANNNIDQIRNEA